MLAAPLERIWLQEYNGTGSNIVITRATPTRGYRVMSVVDVTVWWAHMKVTMVSHPPPSPIVNDLWQSRTIAKRRVI